MTDLEIMKACAEAMGYAVERESESRLIVLLPYFDSAGAVVGHCPARYHPLTIDAQAMALVKRFQLCVSWYANGDARVAWYDNDSPTTIDTDAADINRAICLCVAQMQRKRHD